jgi:hypothetical protein
MGHVAAHYGSVSEEARLQTGFGVLEFARSQEILLRHLPPAPAVVLDIGGAAGVRVAPASCYRVSLPTWCRSTPRWSTPPGVTSAAQGVRARRIRRLVRRRATMGLLYP